MWVQLIIAAVLVILAYALTPRPAEPKPQAMDEVDAPTAEEGKPIPKVYGTYVVKSPNIVWYGDLGYQAVRTKSGK